MNDWMEQGQIKFGMMVRIGELQDPICQKLCNRAWTKIGNRKSGEVGYVKAPVVSHENGDENSEFWWVQHCDDSRTLAPYHYMELEDYHARDLPLCRSINVHELGSGAAGFYEDRIIPSLKDEIMSLEMLLKETHGILDEMDFMINTTKVDPAIKNLCVEIKAKIESHWKSVENKEVVVRKTLFEVKKELERATEKFSKFASPHEGYAVIKEELEELWDLVKRNESKSLMRDEAIQVAAMAIRFVVDLLDENPEGIEG